MEELKDSLVDCMTGEEGKGGEKLNESMRTQSFTNTFLNISSVPQEVEIRFLNESTFSR